MNWVDLVVYTGATCGWSWFLTKSTLLSPVRARLLQLPFVGRVLECIICTSAWVGGAIALCLPLIDVVGFRLHGILDLLFLAGWNLCAVWVIAETVSWLKRGEPEAVVTAAAHNGRFQAALAGPLSEAEKMALLRVLDGCPSDHLEVHVALLRRALITTGAAGEA